MNTHKKITEGMVAFQGREFVASLFPRKGSGVVHLEGALHAGPWYAEPEDEPIAIVTSSLLDEGTQNHSRELFRLTLESVGAQVNFWADGKYLYFSILSTVSALDHALALTFEAMTAPLLSERSCNEVVEREAAARMHDAESTNEQANRALTRLLFSENSAGYQVSPEIEREYTTRVSPEKVRNFFEETYRGRIVVAAVGDISPSTLERLISSHTEKWREAPGKSARGVSVLESPEKPRTAYIPVPGKESIDVFMGSATRILPSDASFGTLRIAVDLLGGGFSDHLMQTIRDRDGLTYGTLARISGIENQLGVRVALWAMFGNALYEKGMQALKKELGVFLSKGITEKRLKEKLVELEGRYAVLFSKPQSAVVEMRKSMLAFGDPTNVSAYIEHVRSLSVSEVQTVAEKHIRIDAISAAGSIDEQGKLLQK